MGSILSFSHIDNYTPGPCWPWPNHAYPSANSNSCAAATPAEAAEPGNTTWEASSCPGHQANSGFPRKPSVEAIVRQFENRHRLSRETPRPISRSATAPASSLRNRLDSALGSRKRTLSGYSQRSISSHITVRAHEREQIESTLNQKQSSSPIQASDRAEQLQFDPPASAASKKTGLPPVSILTTDHSISIHIPEGIKLPVIATIRSSSSFEAHMFSRQTRAGSALERGSVSEDANQRPRSRAATIPEGSEPLSPTPQGTASLRSVRRGVLNISEASVPAPQSSEIFAQGEVFIPDHYKELDHPECANFTPPAEIENNGPEAQPPTPRSDASTEQHPPPSQILVGQSEAVRDNKLERFSPRPIPEIQVHAPPEPDSDTASSLGTGMIKNTANPLEDAARVNESFAASVHMATAASDIPAAVPAPEVLPLVPSVQLPPQPLPDIGVPGVQILPLPVPGPAVLTPGKKGKRKRVIKKTRRFMLRRRLLEVMLGRELANLVYPLLKEGDAAAAGVEVPIDVGIPATVRL